MTTLLSPATLRVADLDEPVRAWLREQRYDQFVEKHEGPLSWGDLVHERSTGGPDDPDFVSFDGHEVLLPVGRSRHEKLRRLRAIVSNDGGCLTLFLSDLSFHTGPGAGRFAFCEQAPSGHWYLCTIWHEWFPTR